MKLLSDQDRTFWHENGYVVIPDVVPARKLDRRHRRYRRIYGQEFS